MSITFRVATPDDAEALAAIIIQTAEGVVEHILDGLVPGMRSDTILSMAFLRAEGVYNPAHVLLAIRAMEGHEQIVGALFAYPASEHRIPGIMKTFISKKRLDPVRPILEHAQPGSLYINTLWLDESERGGGLGDVLMEQAVHQAKAGGVNAISLFCWNDNHRAKKFYARHGFEVLENFDPAVLSLPGHLEGGSILSRPLSCNG